MSADAALPPPDVKAPASRSFPYIIECLRALDAGDKAWTAMFGRNLHFGLWDGPAKCRHTPNGFRAAAENLTRRIIDLAAIAPGSSVLDVGCGFGGTCDVLGHSFSGLRIVGVNIDPTQIARARAVLVPTGHNVIEFVEADACALPQADDSADVILAVECAVHFRSRAMSCIRPDVCCDWAAVSSSPTSLPTPYVSRPTAHYGRWPVRRYNAR
jgi:SAM-dependent methyltransferase